MRTRIAGFAAVVALVLAAGVPSDAAVTVVVSGPGSGNLPITYYTPAAVTSVGGPLTLVNVDIAFHDVVSVADGAADESWCPRYPFRGCPLFASELIGLGATAPVEGLENTVGATVYDFYCSIHIWMTGKLAVLPGA